MMKNPAFFPLAARGLLGLAIVYTLYFTASLLIPIVFAMFLNIAFSPIVARASRLGIPKGISAVLIVTSLVGIAASGLFLFAEPAEEWLGEAPRSVRELKSDLLEAKGRLADIQELANEVEELTDVSDNSSAPQVSIQRPGILESALGDLPFLFAGTGITMILTFFLLAAGDDFLRRMTLAGRNWRERRRIVTIVREVQVDLSRYLGTVTLINIALGAVVALLLQLLGVANPLLWGAMACVFNFAPYLGPLLSTGVLAIVGLSEFDSLSSAMLVPALFLVVTTLEGQLVTPTILGNRLLLSPITVFVSVIFWGWIWGVAGAVMAVPIAIVVRVICARTPSLMPIGTLLFGRAETVPSQGVRSG